MNIAHANWLIIIKRMILQITGTKPNPIPKRVGWKQTFRQSLYKRNKQQLKNHKESRPKYSAQHQRDAESILLSLFEKDQIILKDTTQSSTCHSYYSSYIPIKMQCKFDDELTNTFPYIKFLNDKGRNNDRNLILLEIAEYMKNSKERGEVDIGWQTCLDKYLCGIDSLRAIQLFLQFKKSGTAILYSLHSKYGGKCLQNVFFERIKSSSIYFKKLVVMSKSPFSLQAHEQINQITMSKTMKQMFCSICLIYDCTQHSFDNVIFQKQCHYLSPVNIRSQKENLKNAIGVCMAYRQLLEKGSIDIVQPCSKKCYKYLNTKSWEELQINRARLFSPTVKGVIKLGIQMFSYSPCEIWFLASSEKIYCQQIFFYFIEQFNITAKLQKKMLQSQVQILTRQRQIEANSMPQPMKKQRKKLKLHNIQPIYSSSTCCHFYIGEIPEDLSCENCSCRERGYCLPQCLCDINCPIRKRGCNCKKQQCKTKKCICFSSNAQCDPQVCSNCFGQGATKKTSCKNHAILSNSFKKTRVGRSTISGAGLGLYAGQPIKKNELLMIYSGQLIEHSIDLLRESLSVDNSFYNFGSPEGTIDARYMGNCSRFINHADLGKQNLFSQNIFTQGRCKIGFYAIRDIDKDQQLFFDYDGEGKLYQNYKDKYPFIKEKKWAKT